MQKPLGRCSCEELEVVHHVWLIAVTGFKSDLREIFPAVTQPANMLQTGQTGEPFGSRAHCGAEMPFQRALAHRGMIRHRRNGRAAFEGADHLGGRLDLWRDYAPCTNLTGEETLHCEDLPPYLGSIGQPILDGVNLLPWQKVIELYRPVVEKVHAIVKYSRGAHLGKPNNNQRGVRRVLDHAGSLLQA